MVRGKINGRNRMAFDKVSAVEIIAAFAFDPCGYHVVLVNALHICAHLLDPRGDPNTCPRLIGKLPGKDGRIILIRYRL